MNITWYVIRGAGFAAFVLLGTSVLWGLLVSGKVFGRAVKAKGLQWLHESLGLAAVIAVAIHMIALTLDEFVDFTWVDVLVPGFSEWRPVPSALGVVAFWTMTAVALSFYVKRWIGQDAWRSIHYLSYGAFLAALIHGLTSGTDTGNAVAVAIYAGLTLLVGALTTIRVIASRDVKTRSQRKRPVRTAGDEDPERDLAPTTS